MSGTSRSQVADPSADILVSATAWEQFGELIGPSWPAARWWLFGDDATIEPVDGGTSGDCRPHVAWLTHDLFMTGRHVELLELCRSAPTLRYLQSAAASAAAPVYEDLMGRGVRVATSHATGISIAEFVLGGVLAHFQQRSERDLRTAARLWEQHDFREVSGTTWLIVGLGTVGGALAARVRAFGAHVVGVRRTIRGDEAADEVITLDQVGTHVPCADVVVLCAPPTDATRGLVDAEFLARMRPGSVLVNVARAALVDEAALLRALDRGVPEHALIDVFSDEPLPSSSPFWVHPAVTVSPHSAGCGTGRYRRAAEVFAANLRRYVLGQPLQYEQRATSP